MEAKLLRISAFGICCSLSLQGCALVVPSTVADPREIDLPMAMEQVTCALKARENAERRIGLVNYGIADEITVVFNLKASATRDSKLVVDADVKPPAFLAGLGVNYSDALQQTGERGNTITIKYRDIYTAPLNKAGEAKVAKQGPDLNVADVNRLPVLYPCADEKRPVDNTNPAFR